MKQQPYFVTENSVHSLFVDQQAFLMLGGEIHNSSASDPIYMKKRVWPVLRKLGGTFYLMPVLGEDRAGGRSF